jgi:hypothetical protein
MYSPPQAELKIRRIFISTSNDFTCAIPRTLFSRNAYELNKTNRARQLVRRSFSVGGELYVLSAAGGVKNPKDFYKYIQRFRLRNTTNSLFPQCLRAK